MPLALLLALYATAAEPPPTPTPTPEDSAVAAPTSAQAPAPGADPSPATPAPSAAAEAPSPAPSPEPERPAAAASTAAAPAAPEAVPTAALPAVKAEERSTRLRLISTGLALVPGAAIPGLGHRFAGDSRTANRLLLASGVGGVTAAAGYTMLSLTTGNHDLAPLYLSMLFAGALTWASSWIADIAGCARPEGQGRPFASEDSLTAALLYGPSLAHSGNVKHLGLLRVDYENPKVLLDGWGSLAPGTRYQELHLRAGFKVYGDGKRSHVALVAEGLREVGADSDASGHGGALMVEGRLDAGVLSKSLSGLVLLQRLGGGAISYSYDGSSHTDLQSMLVFESGLALAFTDWFEVSGLYSQRPDKRLGFFMDHGGHVEVQVRAEVHPRVRLVGLSHIGAGMDVMVGAEVSAW